MRSPTILAGTAIWLLTSVGCGASLTGGGTGSGGSTGAGATGGSRGLGGSIAPATDGGERCDQINADYAAALTAALACTPGAPNQCQVVVATAPAECPNLSCGSQELVNDSTGVEVVRGEWLRACDPGGIHSCPAVDCGASPALATCLPTSPGATTGACVPFGSDAGAGVAPDGGESCNQLVADYEAAVTTASACTPGATNQCQSYVTRVPADGPVPSNCQPMTPVNDPSGVNTAFERWSAQCQTSTSILLIICDPPTERATCVPNVDAGVVSGSAGTCLVIIPD